MKKSIYSIFCSIAIIVFTFIPYTSSADGYEVWMFWCGKSATIVRSQPTNEMSDADWELYFDLEESLCGTLQL